MTGRGATICILAALALLAACVSSKHRVDRTGGTSLEMYVHTDDKAMRYKVDKYGMLHFGGGWEAIDGRYTWSHALSDDEIAALASLLDAGAWATDEPRTPDGATGMVYEVIYRAPEERATFTVVGEVASVVNVQAFLDAIAARRFEPALDTLPRASVEGVR